MSNPVNHRCFSEACFPRRHGAGIVPKPLLGHTPAVSSTGSLSLSVRKSGQCGGSDTAATRRRSGEIPSCGRNIVQQEAEVRKSQWNYAGATFASSALVFQRAGSLAGIATVGSSDSAVRVLVVRAQEDFAIARAYWRLMPARIRSWARTNDRKSRTRAAAHLIKPPL